MKTAAKKLDRRVVRTRKAIMEAFERLLAKHPLDKITVSAIAREADIDRKTFYLHYSSVNDLANRKAEEGLERIFSALKLQGAGKSHPERIHIVLMETNAIVEEHLEIYAKIASTLTIDQLLDRFAASIEPVLEHAGVETGNIGSSNAMRLQFYLAGALSLYSTWLVSDHSAPIETVSDVIESAIDPTAFESLSVI